MAGSDDALRFRVRQVAALRGLLAQRTAERDEARHRAAAALAELERATASHDAALRERDAAIAERDAARTESDPQKKRSRWLGGGA
ncbi:MAG: hypothetical protein ACSLFR_09510 [Solirubrobacteraceae bacterium]